MEMVIPEVKRFLLGCDLAKSLDYTSFAVIEMVYETSIKGFAYHLRALDRIRGVDYPAITELILATIQRLQQEPGTTDGPHICMDASGLGAPIRDYLLRAGTVNCLTQIYPVVFTSGESARFDQVTRNYNISKSLIISNFLSLMQRKRFDYSPGLQALPLLQQEISSFKYHLAPSGHTGFDAETGAHDDLICAVCIPLIIGEWQFEVPPEYERDSEIRFEPPDMGVYTGPY